MGYEADGFLAAIAAAPDDDGVRLIYADWLDEQADPRGDLIRVQVALARLPPFDPRRRALADAEAHLLARYADLWSAPFRGLATGPVFRRGFVEEVKVTARQFLAHPGELFRAGPVRHLHLLDGASHVAAALASPHLARLTGLTVYAQYLREPLAEALAASPHLGNLRTLHLGRNHVGDPGCRRLLGAALGPLADLDLADNELTDDAAAQLVAAGRHGTLARLDLGGNALTAAGAARLVGAGVFPRLERLSLARNRLGGRRPGPALARVAALDLGGNGLTPDDVASLLAGPAAGVRELDLGHNRLGDDGARALADAPSAAGLRSLGLANAALTDDGLAALAASPRLARLESLDVRNNPLSDQGFRALLAARSLRRVASLRYSWEGLTIHTRLALERRFNREPGTS